MWKSSLEGNSLVERIEVFFFHYISIYTQLLRIILHTVLIIRHLAFISLNTPVKHPHFLLCNKEIKSTKRWLIANPETMWNCSCGIRNMGGEWGSWTRSWSIKKYFPSECFFCFKTFKEQLTGDEYGVRDISAVLKHKVFEVPWRGQILLTSFDIKASLCKLPIY